MKESMVIYESAYKAINLLPEESLQLEALKGLMEYGFYGVIPESENPFVSMVFVQAIPSMRSAKERYAAATENGRKGGRPTEISTEDIMKMKYEGMSNRQIADRLGLAEKTIENRVTLYNKTHPQNPQNLTVSDTVSVSVPESVSCTASSTETKTETISYTAPTSYTAPVTETAPYTTPFSAGYNAGNERDIWGDEADDTDMPF